MDKKLQTLFDFHRFQQNVKLKSVIQAVESRCVNALDDDELDLVSAAGDVIPTPEDNDDDA